MLRLFLRGTAPALLLILILSGCRTGTGASTTAVPPESDLAPSRLKLLVDEAGIYQITPAMIAAAGLGADTLSPANARLLDGEQIVPAHYQDGALYFYGQASPSRYYAERPYFLELDQPGEEITSFTLPDIRSPLLPTVAQTAHLEEDKVYVSEARQNDEDDTWFWAKLAQQDAFTTEITLPALGDSPTTLRLNAFGVTHNREVEGDHDLEILINDDPAGSLVWDGQGFYTAELVLAPGLIQPGLNTITLDNRPPGANFLDIMQVNWLELDYTAPATAVNDRLTFQAVDGLVRLDGFSVAPLIFEINDPARPQLIALSTAGGAVDLPTSNGMVIIAAAGDGLRSPQLTRVRAAGWSDSGHQADLLIVTTDDLAPALEPLVAAREAQGLSVSVIPVAEIYDEFGGGAPSPEAIQRFVAHAYQTWQEPRPRYLLIVGDATSDYQGHLGELPVNLVPSLMVPVQYSGETVSDSRLADADGDMQPDLAVGRWPVRTTAEVDDLVARTLAYEQTPAGAHTLFATDSSESNFSTIAQRLALESQLPSDSNLQLNGPTPTEIAAEWAKGTWLATYVGHGSIDRWGKEDILDLESAANLNATAVPIVLQLTCLTGLFSHPDQTSLAEAMLLNEGGPVLVVAASSLTLSAHQEPFAATFLQQLQDRSVTRVGDAFLTAKQALDVETSTGYREISDTFGLLGDPSALIARP
jgi:hypothetical protein